MDYKISDDDIHKLGKIISEKTYEIEGVYVLTNDNAIGILKNFLKSKKTPTK